MIPAKPAKVPPPMRLDGGAHPLASEDPGEAHSLVADHSSQAGNATVVADDGTIHPLADAHRDEASSEERDDRPGDPWLQLGAKNPSPPSEQ